MDAIIRWFLNRAPGPIRSAAQWIADLVRAGINWVVGPLRNVASVWRKVYNTGAAMVIGLLARGYETYHTLLWIILVKIPTVVLAKAAELRTWAIQVVNAAENRVRSFAQWVKAQADAAFKWLSDRLASFVAWAVQRVNGLLEFVQWLRTTLLPRLLSPTALAQWLAGAMVDALLRFAFGRAEAIARWLLTSSPTFTRWLARELERILVRLI